MSSDVFLAMNIPRLGDRANRQLEEQAQARGHAAGYTDGLRAARTEIDGRIARLDAEHAAMMQQARDKTDRTVALVTAAARALNERSLPLLSDANAALAAAAVELAEAILGYELADGPRSARAALARALEVPDPREVRAVRLHPDDLALLDNDIRAAVGVELRPDSTLRRGDAVTEFPDGYLDARISTALARAQAALLRENR
jgi:flagellar assembly protein FliH